MRSSILLFEQRRADNPMVATPSTRHLMDAVARMEDEGFKQIVVCGLQSEDAGLLAELTAEIQRFMSEREQHPSVIETARGDFEELHPEETGDGFMPHGPSGPDPFLELSESMFTAPQLRYGQFECLNAQGELIGAMFVIPKTYTPLLHTPWSGMDHWCWKPGHAWPESFQLRGVHTPIETAAFGSWESYGHESFETFNQVPPVSGQLYRINRRENTGALGYLNRESAEPWDQSWWALSDEVTQSRLIHMRTGDTLVFSTVSMPGDDITEMWTLVAPAM